MNLHPGQVRAWNSNRRYIFVLAGTQGGKCQRIGERIWLKNGNRRRVEEMQVGDEVLVLKKNLKIGTSRVTKTYDNGVQPTYRLRTGTGRELILTAEHPLLSKDGWKPSSEFEPGEFIAVPRTLPMEGTNRYDHNWMKILGYLLADGALTRGTPSFCKTDPFIRNDFEACLPEGCTLTTTNGKDWRIKGYREDGSGWVNPVKRWLNKHDLCVKSVDKSIPEFVFGLVNEDIAPMLNAIFACDGWVDKKGIGIGLSSKPFIRDIQHLLLRFGIMSRLRYKRSKVNGKEFDAWDLTIRDLSSMETFSTRIGILGKQNKLNRLIAEKRLNRDNDQDAYSDIYWDTVESIEYDGDHPVYDITVEGSHNFISEDIFAHNTSFGPWWLHREITKRSGGDYLAVTSSFDLFKLKMLPEMLRVFETKLQIGRYWKGAGIIEIKDPDTGRFWANMNASDEMYGRIILRSAQAGAGKRNAEAVGVSGLESATASGAWLDEVGMDAFTEAAWDAVVSRLSLKQGRVLATTTLYNTAGWMKRVIYDPWKSGDPSIDVIQFDSIDNPIFPIREFLDRRERMPRWKFNLRYRGVYDKPAGMIFHDFNRDVHLVEPFQIPDDWKKYVGIDPGAIHTATVWGAIQPETKRLYIYNESLTGDRTMSQHARDFVQLAGGSLRNHIFVGGSASEKQFRLDMQSNNIMVKPPLVTDVEAGIDRIISLFRSDKIRIFNSCSGLISQIEEYSRKLGRDGEATEAIHNKEQYHMIDALRYLATIIEVPLDSVNPSELKRPERKVPVIQPMSSTGTRSRVPRFG